MTPKKIYRDRPDIKEKVEMTYPETPKEKKCRLERAKQEQKRWELAKRMYNEKTIP